MSDLSIVNQYVAGSTIRLVATLASFEGAAVRPVSVRLLALPPGGVASVLVPVTVNDFDAVGMIVANTVGTWRYRFETNAEPFAAVEGSFTVKARTVPAYIGV